MVQRRRYPLPFGLAVDLRAAHRAAMVRRYPSAGPNQKWDVSSFSPLSLGPKRAGSHAG